LESTIIKFLGYKIMLQLYSYYRSSAAYRVRIALNYKDIEYELVPVNLVKNEQQCDEYLRVNPQGLLPALRLNNGDIITQSTAILEWLEEAYVAPALYPLEKLTKAKTRTLCNVIACDIHPLNNLRVLKHITGELNASEEQKLAWYQHWIELGFSNLESQLSGFRYAIDEKVTMVDVYLVPQVYNAIRFGQDMNNYPNIMRVYNTCNELESCKEAAPESQPDAK
jgi:maleylpyruvate isomerase